MELNKSHKDLNIDKQLTDFFKSHKPDFKKSKQAEWEQLQTSISRDIVKPFYTKPIFRYAAILIILMSISILARYYSKDIYCRNGEHITAILPDSSIIIINADTKVSYYPIWWYIARNIKLEGEAYFEVKKGSKFSVISDNGTTSVLGTSFNIFARRHYYNVSCRTGKVKIETNSKIFTITKGQKISNNLLDGKSEESNIPINNISPWKNNRLIFTSAPLEYVFDEIERQYNINIDYKGKQRRSFSGSLSLKDNQDKNIEIICRPFFLEKQKIKSNRYSIKEKRE
jgi:ferric-dicitrate binding protein FerR (iron transport regulator)